MEIEDSRSGVLATMNHLNFTLKQVSCSFMGATGSLALIHVRYCQLTSFGNLHVFVSFGKTVIVPFDCKWQIFINFKYKTISHVEL